MVDEAKPESQKGSWSSAMLPNPFFEAVSPPAPSQDASVPGVLPKISKVENHPPALKWLQEHSPNFGSPFLQSIPVLDEYHDQTRPLEELARGGAVNTIDDPAVAGPRQVKPKLRGVGLLGAVFDILSKQLGAEYSTAELMLAAQQLIDISKAEYVGVVHREGGDRAGYYSWDLARAFSSHAWQVACVETPRMDHCDIDEYSPESYESARFLIQGRGERTWDF